MSKMLYQYCYQNEELYKYPLEIIEFSKFNNAYLCNYKKNPSVDIYVSGYELNKVQYNSFDDAYIVYTEFEDIEMVRKAIISKIKEDEWKVLNDLQKKIDDTIKQYDKK